MRILLTGLCLTCSLGAADREFRDVVDSISSHFHTRPMRIPLFGLVNVVAAAAHPAGARHIDLAVFENLHSWNEDGRNLSDSIHSAVGGAWKPFVQVRSTKKGEVVFVYMRPDGGDWRLLLVSVEPHEAVVVQLQLNMAALQRWVMSPGESALSHSHGRFRDVDP